MVSDSIRKTVALFDLDGVVFDTEPLYSRFWKQVFNEYYPEMIGLEQKIKGQTLHEIYDKFFNGKLDLQKKISQELDAFEQEMSFFYVNGFREFLADIKNNGMKVAVVTSSNKAKMSQVFSQHTDFKTLFDIILTSEDFSYSKPHPDPYLKAASYLKVMPSQCIGFEDSFNGLKSVKAAQMFVVGLTTSNSSEQIASYCNLILPNYVDLTYNKLQTLVTSSL